MNQLDFEGRHAVVTGGATGLGYAHRAAADRLGRQRHPVGPRRGGGAARPRSTLGAKADSSQVDVSQHDIGARRRASHPAQAQRIDALVNSAGITGPEHQGVGLPGRRLARR